MTELRLRNEKINSLFQLLGDKENDRSYSVGWALAKSPSLLRQVIKTLGYSDKYETDAVLISLQEAIPGKGITDIEIKMPNQFHFIIEAKCGHCVPSKIQLRQYVKRLLGKENIYKRIAVLSDCRANSCFRMLGFREINGIKVVSLTWQELVDCTKRAKGSSPRERYLLEDFLAYFEVFLPMERIYSNWVYCVAIAWDKRDDWDISWADLVQKRGIYFHKIGIDGWPSNPPNYIAFRFYGKLQSIHHIESWETFTDPHTICKEIRSEEWEEMFLYHLGPAFAPAHEVKLGNLYPKGRLWLMMDTIFTSQTIEEALRKTKKREGQI